MVQARRPDADMMDDGGCARCTVVRKVHYNDNGVWESTDGWYRLYEGVSSNDGKHRVMAVESNDLHN